MTPHRVISWQRAIVLLFTGKVEVLEEYDEEIRAPSITVRTPAVVRLTNANLPTKNAIRFTRINVFTRDGFRCQYCGERKDMSRLNYDHVVPRVRGGRTNWENIVTSCYACNDRKGSRTPLEAGMKLLRKPIKPLSLPHVPLFRPGREFPASWKDYVAL